MRSARGLDRAHRCDGVDAVISLAIAAGLFGYFLGLLTVYLGGALYDARARRRAARHPNVIELDRARRELLLRSIR